MKKSLNKLQPEDLSFFQSREDLLTIPTDMDFVYEKQIPHAVLALLQGEIQLTKRSKPKEIIPSGHILGIHHILNDLPVNMGCKIIKGSKIVLIGKFELLEAFRFTDSKLYQLIKKFL